MGWGGRTPTLTLTPTFESDFTREQFIDVLRVLGPIAERTLLDREDEPEVCVCVIDRAEKHAWWAETVARECLPRMYARGRVRAAFWKREFVGRRVVILHFRVLVRPCADWARVWTGYWDDCTWSEDRAAGREPETEPVQSSLANVDTDTDTDTVTEAASVHLAVPVPLTASPAADAPAPAVVLASMEDSNAPQVQPDGGDSYVVMASTSARTAQESISSVSWSTSGIRQSLRVCA